MKEPIGEILLGVAAITLGIAWITGWVWVLISILIQKIFPKAEPKVEKISQVVVNIIGPIQKYSLIALIVIFALGLLARLLNFLFISE